MGGCLDVVIATAAPNLFLLEFLQQVTVSEGFMLQQQEFMQREIHESHEEYFREAIEAASHIEATELHRRRSIYNLEAVHRHSVLTMESKARPSGQLQNGQLHNGQLLHCESGFHCNTIQSLPKVSKRPWRISFAIDGRVCPVLCLVLCLYPLPVDRTQELRCFALDMA